MQHVSDQGTNDLSMRHIRVQSNSRKLMAEVPNFYLLGTKDVAITGSIVLPPVFYGLWTVVPCESMHGDIRAR